jgi:hypothetical protein
MTPLSLRLSLVAVGALLIALWLTFPRGVEAARWLAAEDDPVALANLVVDRRLDAAAAAREIEAALAAGDAELAQSFLELARERHVPVEPALAARVGAGTPAAVTYGAGQFVRGLIIGEPDDLASLAGTVTGDLFVFGDVRDAVREGVRLARGEEADELILGLACVGLAVTAATYASLGAGTPARVGLSVVKAARRTGRIGRELSGAVVRAVKESVDAAAVRQAFSRAALVRPALAVRAAREAVKVEKAGGLLHLARDIGQVQAKAGSRAALDGLKLADSPKDVSRLARLAQAKGTKTRAIIKLAGRGAIMLTTGLFSLASWVFWAAFNLFMLCVMLKRSVERITMHAIRRRKARRAQSSQLRPRPLAAPAPAV